jgi:hypothetical protein
MSNELLLPQSCYICMEYCNTTSPCECNAPVHRKCLYEFNMKRNKTHCTICQQKFRDSMQILKILFKCFFFTQVCLIFVLFSVVAYIVCGFVGEYTWSVLGICECLNITNTFGTTISTVYFVGSSVSMFLTITLSVYLIKKCLETRSI